MQNPFNIALTGTGALVGGISPDISLEQPSGHLLVSGGTRSFGTVALHKKATLTFTVRNTVDRHNRSSAAILKVSRLSLSGPNAGEFHLSLDSLNLINPGKNKTFKVQFSPQSEGNKEALLSIISNDPDESPYVVSLSGRTPNGDDHHDKTIPVAGTAPIAPSIAVAQAPAPSPTVGSVPPQNASASHPVVPPLGVVDGTGLYHWLAYAFSGDPAQAAENDAQARQVAATVDGQDFAALNFRRLKAADTLTFVVEESTDMVHWSAVPTPWLLAEEIVDQGDGYEWLTVLASAPLPVDGQYFMRLRVENAP